MFRYPDLDSVYESCLQCGYNRELTGVPVGRDGRTTRAGKQPAPREQLEFHASLKD